MSIIVDPVTRIEGHLKAEVFTDTDEPTGTVTNVKVSGTMARGVEALLKGKDPRDASYVTARICGVCFGAHCWTSCRAVEDANDAQLPEAARLLRNLIVGACWLHDHPLHFYHLAALDYLDLAVLTSYGGDDPDLLKIKELIDNNDAGPLLPRYDPDQFCIADPPTVALAVRHYLNHLVMQVKAKKMSALFAGKQPHQSGIVVGGVTELPSRSKRDQFRYMLDEQIEHIETIYDPDVMLVATWLLDQGLPPDFGAGHDNFLSYGGFPEAGGSFLYPEGAIVDGELVAQGRANIETALTEDVTKAWYTSAGGGHPSQSTQIFNLDKLGAHSFVKAPRFKYGDPEVAYPMEVGPIARMMVAMKRGVSHDAVTRFTGLYNAGVRGVLLRHAARMLETLMLCHAMKRWLDELEDLIETSGSGMHGVGVQIHDTAAWEPRANVQGWGMTEAPRGALAHWIKTDSAAKIDRYACVVPTTWNASPTDGAGKKGPYEQALMGLSGLATPLNIVRVIRSFDPCIACAVHVITSGGDVKKFMLDV